MQTIALNKPGAFSHKIEMPNTWDELTVQELEMLARAQLAAGEDQSQGKAIVFCHLVESRAAKQGIALPADWKTQLNYEDAATAGFDYLKFLYDQNTLTINPYKELTVAGKRMIGPADDFNEILCGEMEDCEVFFFLFNNEPSLSLLAKIAAILWRPRNAKYVAKASEKRQKDFEKLPAEKLFVIYMWYTGCRNKLPLIFPEVYNGEGTGELDITAFTKCIHAGAGPKNGTRENIRSMPAKEFLFDMNLEAQHAQEQKEAHEHN